MGTPGQTQTALGPTRMFVGGDWRDARAGTVEHAASPATGEDLGPVAQGDREDAHAEAYDEVDELIVMWRAAAEDGIRLEGTIAPSSSPGKRVLLLRRALGPVAVITPWNWPYTMPAEIVAPALAAGNTVVWTPAPTTSVCSGLLAECVAEADLPPGVFTFVLGPGRVVGDDLVVNRGRGAIAFIGPTATGRLI